MEERFVEIVTQPMGYVLSVIMNWLGLVKMPYEVKGKSLIYRCQICGKMIHKDAIQFKTCCMNKPVVLCSQRCMRIWETRWLRQQEQIMKSRKKNIRGYII